jgi:hypothetical protein
MASNPPHVQGIEAGRIPTQVTSLIEAEALPAHRGPPLARAPPEVPLRVFAIPTTTLAPIPAPPSAVAATCTLSCLSLLLLLLLLCMRILWTWGR